MQGSVCICRTFLKQFPTALTFMRLSVCFPRCPPMITCIGSFGCARFMDIETFANVRSLKTFGNSCEVLFACAILTGRVLFL